MDNDRLIKSFLWYEDTCYFVSTIDRDSSSCLGGRFAETLVWEYDWEANERLKMCPWQESASEGSIRGHQRMVDRIHATGSGQESDDNPCTHELASADNVIVDDEMVERACAAYLGYTGTAFNWENAGEEWRAGPRVMMRRSLKAALDKAGRP